MTQRALRLSLFRRLFALCFELGELLGGKNSLCLFKEGSSAFFRAAGFHALALPRFNLCLLIGRQIEARQISTGRLV